MNQSIRLALQHLEQIRSLVQDGCSAIPAEELLRLQQMASDCGWPNVEVNVLQLIDSAKSLQQLPIGNEDPALELAKARFLQACYTVQIELAQIR